MIEIKNITKERSATYSIICIELKKKAIVDKIEENISNNIEYLNILKISVFKDLESSIFLGIIILSIDKEATIKL